MIGEVHNGVCVLDDNWAAVRSLGERGREAGGWRPVSAATLCDLGIGGGVLVCKGTKLSATCRETPLLFLSLRQTLRSPDPSPSSTLSRSWPRWGQGHSPGGWRRKGGRPAVALSTSSRDPGPDTGPGNLARSQISLRERLSWSHLGNVGHPGRGLLCCAGGLGAGSTRWTCRA